MRKKISKAVLILLLICLPGCGKKESSTEGGTADNIEDSIENSEDVSAETESADSTESENEEAASVESDSPYPLVAAPSAEKIDFVFVSEGNYCIFDGEKYGYIAEDGEEITPCIYDIAYPFSEGLACVFLEGKYGYIDLTGETAIPFTYDRATPFVEGLAYFAVGDTYGFMDKTGRQVFSFECDSVSSFQEGLAYFTIDGRYGYIDPKGQIVIEPVFDDAGYFQDGLAKVMKDGRYGVINREGELIAATEYDSVTIGDSFIIACSDEKDSCFDKTGKVLLEQYDHIYFAGTVDSMTGGKYLYVEKAGKYGLADERGTVLFEPLYDMISLLPGENFLLVRENELYGVIDLQGEVRISAVYDYIWYDKYMDGTGDGMLVLRDMDGNMESVDLTDLSKRVPCSYDSIDWISHTRAVVSLDGLSGIVDREENLIEPIVYDRIQAFAGGAVWMKNDKETRFYNNRGEVVEDIGFYDDISEAGNYYQIEKNGQYGFMNEEGEEVISPVYSYVTQYGVYGCTDNIYIVTNRSGDAWDSIIKTGEPENSDISKVILQNEITPRNEPYQEFTRSGSISITSIAAEGGIFTVNQEELRGCKKTYKLYDLNHTGEPILYFEAEPYQYALFPNSYSGFYAIRNNQLVEMVTGYECGGSLRGDYACLWYDRETFQTLPGTNGYWGGFGGMAYAGKVYDEKDGEITSITALEWVTQPISYFSGEQLAHAELVYDEEDKPYTKERIEQAEKEIATVYFVNDEQTTIEEYQKMSDRFQMLSCVE